METHTRCNGANDENAIHIMQVEPMIQMSILLSKEKKTKREEFINRRKINYII